MMMVVNVKLVMKDIILMTLDALNAEQIVKHVKNQLIIVQVVMMVII